MPVRDPVAERDRPVLGRKVAAPLALASWRVCVLSSWSAVPMREVMCPPSLPSPPPPPPWSAVPMREVIPEVRGISKWYPTRPIARGGAGTRSPLARLVPGAVESTRAWVLLTTEPTQVPAQVSFFPPWGVLAIMVSLLPVEPLDAWTQVLQSQWPSLSTI